MDFLISNSWFNINIGLERRAVARLYGDY